MNYFIGLLLLFIGIAIGLNLPDLDYRVSFLVHRSIVTHSFFFPLLLFWLIPKKEKSTIYWLSIGFSLSFVTHFCFDLFPKAWTGYALISIPLYGRSSPLFSWVWIAGSIVFCLYLALLLVKNLGDIFIIVGSAVVSFSLGAATESAFWPALLALIVAVFIVLMLPSSFTEVLRKLIRKFISAYGGHHWKAEKMER